MKLMRFLEALAIGALLSACAPAALSAPRIIAGTVAASLYAEGLDKPVDLRFLPDGQLLVAEQGGRVVVLEGGVSSPVLELEVGCCGEQGLLSATPHPDFARNGYLFVYYVEPTGEHTVLSRWQLSDSLQADPASERVLLRIPQPGPTHNGGQLQFGPDGHLYLSTGDGEYRPSWLGANTYAQDPGLLGKVLRLDVDARSPRVPRAEVWALGLRNPWRLSFDAQMGALFIADVGETRWEEVNIAPAGSRGRNYGWPLAEGPECRAETCPGLVPPALSYPHVAGCSVTGGYVYRGTVLPELHGRYLYADFCAGTLWSAAPSGESWRAAPLLETGAVISTFGQDAAGELYFTDYAAGAVYRLEPSAPSRSGLEHERGVP